jgi:hypothetical protein
MNNPEADIAALIADNPAIMALLTGGVYQSGLVGIEGITRETTPAAFDDVTGYLLPCCLVRQRDLIPTFDVLDFDAQAKSTNQIVECWLYQDAPLYDVIDAVSSLIYGLLQGKPLPYSFELDLVNVIGRQRDGGALNNASLGRLDFAVYRILTPAG